jgi:uncharacterized protein YndB with AHSA1/START domain
VAVSSSDLAGAPATPDLILTREFRAPRALVWQAWTDPAHLVKWWGPHRFTTPRFDIDLRPGGAIRLEMRGPDGLIYPAVGTVREIVELARLAVVTSLLQDGAAIAEVLQDVTFEDTAEGTRVTLRAKVLRSTTAAAAALAGMREGWSQSLDRLTSYATTTATEREMLVTRRFHAPIDLVWAAWTSPARLEAWWGPTGFTTSTSEFDLVSGGRWVYVMHGPDGVDYPNVMTFSEIVPGRRLAYAHSGGRTGDPTVSFEATVVFERDEVGTRLTFRFSFASSAGKRHFMDGYGAYDGAHETLDRLADHLQVP